MKFFQCVLSRARQFVLSLYWVALTALFILFQQNLKAKAGTNFSCDASPHDKIPSHPSLSVFLSGFSVSRHSEATQLTSYEAAGQYTRSSLKSFATLSRQNSGLDLVSLHPDGWSATVLSSHSHPAEISMSPRSAKQHRSHIYLVWS